MQWVVAVVAAIVVLGAGVFRFWNGGWPRPGDLRLGRLAASIAIGVLLIGVAIQLVPYGHDHTNLPVLAEPAWDSERTLELARRACFDCHSNEVEWPWYTNVAPMSWLVLGHVEEGREELNFSEWGRDQEIDEIVESVVEGEMPPRSYTLVNSKGRLSDTEEAELIRGLERTFGRGDDND